MSTEIRKKPAKQPVALLMAITVILTLSYPRPAQAKTFKCGAGDVSCLIGSINQANTTGRKNTIRLDAGTYILSYNNDTDGPNGLPSITSELTIEGAGADLTILERPSSAPKFRLLHVGTRGDLTLDGVTLTGGNLSAPIGGRGAGIYNNSGAVTLMRCIVKGNSGASGGGIYNKGGEVTITKSIFSGNSVISGGGGLFNDGGEVTLIQSTFAQNVSEVAALGTNGGTVRITQSRFTKNLGFHTAGGLEIDGGTVFIATSTFDHNAADGAGAIDVRKDATLVVTNSAFTDNAAAFDVVGAIGNFGGSAVIVNTTFARNSSVSGVSTIDNFSGNLTLINSTLAENASRPTGRALATGAGATTTLQNTILARNVTQDCGGTVTSLGNNLIGDQSGCNIILQPSDLIGDPGLDTFTDNGQPGNGHFPLLPNSQAINAGNKAACPKVDQIGERRRGHCDIGAIESTTKGKDRNEDDQDNHHKHD